MQYSVLTTTEYSHTVIWYRAAHWASKYRANKLCKISHVRKWILFGECELCIHLASRSQFMSKGCINVGFFVINYLWNDLCQKSRPASNSFHPSEGTNRHNSQNLHTDYYRFSEIILIILAITQHGERKQYLKEFVNA
jgi:hypothetical protein